MVALASGWMAQASIVIETLADAEIPTSYTGLSSAVSLSGEIGPIQNLRVSLNISGVPNGNLYAYLSHGSDLVVLLNRVGRTASDSAGYQDMGLNVAFEQNMADVHQYRPAGSGPLLGPLTGAWGVDGRNVSPFTVTDASARTTYLSSFVGKDPNGEWFLFVANLGDGGAGAKLESWGLEMNYAPVPEAGTWVSGMACVGLIGLTALVRKHPTSGL